MELLLNRRGLRVDFHETQGLFSKRDGADRYLPCLTWARVNADCPISIGRLWAKGECGRRRKRWRAAALCGRVAGDGERGAAGLESPRVRVREVARDITNSTGYIGWGASQWPATARGGEADGGATASTIPASERAYGPLQLAHKDKEGPGVLTEAWTWAKRQRKVVGVDGRRRRMTKLGGEIDVGVLRASGTHDPVRACSVEVQRGSDRTTVHRRQGIAAAGRLTRGSARHKSGRYR